MSALLHARTRAAMLARQSQSVMAAAATSQLRGLATAGNAQSTNSEQALRNVTVFGSGLMGAGIVQVAAHKGFNVTMVDLSDAALDNGRNIIRSSLKRVARKMHPDNASAQQQFIDEVFTRVTTTTNTTEAVRDADLVVEAIVENIDTKRRLFEQLDSAAPAKTIFTSNTSSLPIGAIAKATKRADRFAGLHFFNPVPQMKLVEVIRTADTSETVFNALIAFSRQLGKAPVACKDTPGFIVNRLLVPYMMEALRILERGDATVTDIDTAMKLGAGYPMGPFELMDYVGLDTLKFIADGWFTSSEQLKNNPLIGPSKELERLVASGKLGRKSGAGFYEYEGVGGDRDRKNKA